MPKSPTHDRLQLRAAMQMAAYATLESSVKQHINEMIDDLRKECQKNQIATNGVISALCATQKQHLKELRELSKICAQYKEAHTRICESIAGQAVRDMKYSPEGITFLPNKLSYPYKLSATEIYDCTARIVAGSNAQAYNPRSTVMARPVRAHWTAIYNDVVDSDED